MHGHMHLLVIKELQGNFFIKKGNNGHSAGRHDDHTKIIEDE